MATCLPDSHCQEQDCIQLLGLLPTKCQACNSFYCPQHINCEEHSCPEQKKWDVARYFPRCSLCMAEVPLASGQDHGVALTLHFLQYHQGCSNRRLQDCFRCDECGEQEPLPPGTRIVDCFCQSCRKNPVKRLRYQTHTCPPAVQASTGNREEGGREEPAVISHTSTYLRHMGEERLKDVVKSVGRSARLDMELAWREEESDLEQCPDCGHAVRLLLLFLIIALTIAVLALILARALG